MGRLFWKFFLAFWLSLAAAGAGVGGALWVKWKTSDFEPQAPFLVQSMATALKRGGPEVAKDLLLDWQREGHLPIFVVDENGRDLLGRPVPPQLHHRVRHWARNERGLKAHGAAERGPNERRPGERRRNLAHEVTAADGRSYLVVAVPLLGRNRGSAAGEAPRLFQVFVVTAGVLASLLFSASLAWYLAKPIRGLQWGFAAVAKGDLEARVGPRMGTRRDELADLGRGFDSMAQHLERLIGAQRRLLHDVSHELRSPLARLQVAVGLLRQSPEKAEPSLERIEREVGRLDQLVGEVLTLSHLDAGAGKERRRPTEVVELLAAVVDDAHFEAQALGREVRLEAAGEATLAVDAESLHRAFENIIRNAVKHTAEGSTVEVVARVEAGVLLVTVADRGPGVPAADLAKIFEPFYRAESATAGSAPDGFGLGLAIARRATEVHGGSIRARNRDGGGLVVEMRLPLG